MRHCFISAILMLSSILFAQAPQAFNYQGIARDVAGSPLANRNISLQLTIREGDFPGTEVYSEIQYATTNNLGLFALEVGRGAAQAGSINSVDWGNGDHFIQIDMDINGGTTFSPMGIAQLLSVPYALYAENGGSTSQWENSNWGVHYNGGHVGIGTVSYDHALTIVDDVPDDAGRFLLHLQNTTLSDRSFVGLSMSSGEDSGFTYLNHHGRTYNYEEDNLTDFGQLMTTGRGLIIRAESPEGVIRFLTGYIPAHSPPERMRITHEGNIGIGTQVPASKLQITDGDVYIENIQHGVIMKSPNGNCWRMTINNDGSVLTTAIVCPN